MLKKIYLDKSYPRFLRYIALHPRLFISVLMGIASFFLIPFIYAKSHLVSRVIFAWNIGAILYLCLAMHLIFTTNLHKMRRIVKQQYDGRIITLILTVCTTLITLLCIIKELSIAKNLSGTLRYLHIFLVFITIVTSWFFTQTMFAFYYAHEYYINLEQKENAGLIFPDSCQHQPNYGDFLYFACIIGTSAQTGDVSFSSSKMRRIGTLHCVVCFLFNTTILSLGINIASSFI
jgi:uncharacterized membrane protein